MKYKNMKTTFKNSVKKKEYTFITLYPYVCTHVHVIENA